MRKQGRPTKTAKDTKAILLQVRITADEKEAFQAAANVAGIDLAAWARERLRRSAIRDLEQIGMLAKFLKKTELESE